MVINDITLLVDKSGSMSIISKQTESAVKEYIMGLKKGFLESDEPCLTYFTLRHFDSSVNDYVYEKELISHIDCENYVFSTGGFTALQDAIGFTALQDAIGFTALQDAIGFTLDDVLKRIEKYKEEGYEQVNTMLAVWTDGEENSSTTYSGQSGQLKLRSKISEFQGMKDCDLVFLSSDIKTIQVAENMGIDMNSIKFDAATDKGIGNTFESLYSYTTQTTGSLHRGTKSRFTANDYQKSDLIAGVSHNKTRLKTN